MTSKRQYRRPELFVAAATIAYACVFFLLGWDRYATYHAGSDLGLFTQSIDTAFRGFHNTIENGSHFTYHFSPILYLCAPLLWLAHSALALVAVQAIATALIAPALYSIARKRTSDIGAAGLACLSLLYPPLQGVTFTEFHELGFLPAAIAWLLWAIDARRFTIAAALLVLTLSIKEDQAIAMAFVGVVAVVYFARRGERAGVTFGAVAVCLSAVVFAAYFVLIRPLAGAATAWHPSHFYEWSGYTHGLPLGRELGGRLTYLLEAFVPLAFIPFRSRALLLSLPGFFEVLLSREPLMYTMGQYYAALWIPYVLVAFVLAAAPLLATNGGVRWVRTSAALCVLVLVFFSPLHLGHYLRMPNAQDAATTVLIARIPTSAGVGSYDEIYAHLGFYPHAQLGLNGLPQYVIFNSGYASPMWNEVVYPRLQRDIAQGRYRLVDRAQGVVLYERTVNDNAGRAH
jgi:uncharacterized membrane protein